MKNVAKSNIFITGANSGLGLEFARQYLNDGCRVYGTYRKEELAGELKSLKGDLHLFRLDITDIKAVEQVRNQIKDESIDVLLNNAAIRGPEDEKATFGHLDIQRWTEVMHTNLFSTIKFTEMFFDLVKRSREKKIVFISSRAGSLAERGKLPHHVRGGTYIYRSSKAALNAVTQSLAFDYTPMGISVIVMHPGFVKTERVGNRADITVEHSIQSMRNIISAFTPEKNGVFYNYDGSPIPW